LLQERKSVEKFPGGIMSLHGGDMLKWLSMKSIFLGGKENTHSQLVGCSL